MSTLTDSRALARAVSTFAKKSSDKTLSSIAAEITAMADTSMAHVHVVNTGLLKAGKSSLFNALVGKENEFKTAEIRCTVENQHSHQESFVLVDTPGIDANEADTAEAEATLKQADLILFVHNAKAGELDRVELAYLEQLRQFFPDKGELRRRVLPVFSRIDGVEQKDFLTIMERTMAQWQDLLGFVPDHNFFTSSTRFFKGISENKPDFVEKSGIAPLRQYLQDQAETLRLRKEVLVAGRLWDRLSELHSQLGSIRQSSEAAANAREKDRLVNRQRLYQRAKEMFEALSSRAQAYRDMPGNAYGGMWGAVTSLAAIDVVTP